MKLNKLYKALIKYLNNKLSFSKLENIYDNFYHKDFGYYNNNPSYKDLSFKLEAYYEDLARFEPLEGIRSQQPNYYIDEAGLKEITKELVNLLGKFLNIKKKKQPKDWYLATTYWLTAGFAMPKIVAIFLGIPMAILVGSNHPVILEIILAAISLLGIWLGVIYAVKYFAKTYIVKNKDYIIKRATILFAVVNGLFELFALLLVFTATSIIDLGFFIIGVILFNKLSQKYLKND